MKKSLILFVSLFFSLNAFTQKDSIVNFIGYKNKVLKKVDKAYHIEVITKESDSLWLRRVYKRNGKLSSLRYYTNKNKSKASRIGQYIKFDKNDSINSIAYYNKKGQKHGKFQSWFNNRKYNLKGNYINDKKEGLWTAYHYSGKTAVRSIFKNDSLIKREFYNIKGIKTEKADYPSKFNRPTFKGGKKKFEKKLREITRKINFKIKGRIFVNFVVDVKGNIDDAEVYENIPNQFKKQIIDFLKKIKGWKPATHLNRKVPYSFTMPLNFKG